MRKLLSLLMTLLLVVSSAASPAAYTTEPDHCYTSIDRTGAYRITYSGRNAEITRYGDSTDTVSLRLETVISAICAYDDRVVLFSDDSSNNQLIMSVYNIKSDITDIFALYGDMLYADTDYCCDNRYVYLENAHDPRQLEQYDYFGSLVNTYRFENEITAVTNGYDGGAYIVSGTTLCYLNGTELVNLPGESVTSPLFPVERDIVSSVYGDVYILDGNSIDYSYTVEADGCAQAACVSGNVLYYPCGSRIYSYRKYTGKKIGYYDCGYAVGLLYANGNTIVAVSADSGSVTRVNKDHFIEIPTATLPSSAPAVTQDDQPLRNSGISSAVYTVDFTDLKISDIPAGTTVAGFRSNMRYDGYSVTVYRDSVVRKSGTVGTAMTAVFQSVDDSYTFELSVNGDLTGEGNCNSRDLNLLMDYLIGAADFNGVYTLAADLSKDCRVDVIDMAMMKRAG